MAFILVLKEVIFGYCMKVDGSMIRSVQNNVVLNSAYFMALLSIYRSSTST